MRHLEFNTQVASAITGPRFFGTPAVVSVLAGSGRGSDRQYGQPDRHEKHNDEEDEEEATAHSIHLNANGSGSSSHNRGWQPCGRATSRFPDAAATCLNIDAIDGDTPA